MGHSVFANPRHQRYLLSLKNAKLNYEFIRIKSNQF